MNGDAERVGSASSHAVSLACGTSEGSFMSTQIMSVSLPEAASISSLTDMLRRAGALDTGRVSAVHVTGSASKIRSSTVRLALTYEGGVAGAPTSLFLKTALMRRDGRPVHTNDREITFYRDVAPALPPGLVPRCYGTVNAADATPWSLLLEDLSGTHAVATEHPLPPPAATCRSILRRWGRLHAAFWDDARLDTLAEQPPAEAWTDVLRRSEDRYRTFINRHGDLLSVERRRVYQQLLAAGPRLVERFRAGRPLTLVHGDAHWWNCLAPRGGDPEDVRLIDWEDWTVAVGAMDVAYAVAMLWFPDRRRALERSLLDDYHEALVEGGVSGYDRRSLDEDYRWSVVLGMLRPIWQATGGLPAGVWWPNLERNALAFEDLGCVELLS